MSPLKHPPCESPYRHELNDLIVCPECAFEWKAEDYSQETVVKDGNVLSAGDTVFEIKYLPLKVAPKPIKVGVTAKKIRLVEEDRIIDFKIDDFVSMALKSEFGKKA